MSVTVVVLCTSLRQKVSANGLSVRCVLLKSSAGKGRPLDRLRWSNRCKMANKPTAIACIDLSLLSLSKANFNYVVFLSCNTVSRLKRLVSKITSTVWCRHDIHPSSLVCRRSSTWGSVAWSRTMPRRCLQWIPWTRIGSMHKNRGLHIWKARKGMLIESFSLIYS